MRQIRLVPRNGRVNHYVPLSPRPVEMDVEPAHHPCDGTLCGDRVGDPCYALLCSQRAPWGMAPANCMSDGNCAFDAMLFWDGGSKTAADIKNLRHELANVVLEHSGEETWQTAFQLSGEGPPEEPPSASPQSPLRGESPPRLRGTSPQAGTPPPRTRSESPGRCNSTPPKTTREKLLDDAIAWKLGVKRPPKYLLYGIGGASGI